MQNGCREKEGFRHQEAAPPKIPLLAGGCFQWCLFGRTSCNITAARQRCLLIRWTEHACSLEAVWVLLSLLACSTQGPSRPLFDGRVCRNQFFLACSVAESLPMLCHIGAGAWLACRAEGVFVLYCAVGCHLSSPSSAEPVRGCRNLCTTAMMRTVMQILHLCSCKCCPRSPGGGFKMIP